MDVKHRTDSQQAALWNGGAGHAWAAAQEVLDQVLQPFEDLLVDAVHAASACRVLDVGCGAGSTTRAVARRLGQTGSCIGIDISEPMIAAAQTSAQREDSPACFVQADAQTHAFAPASFDMIISRFGVMFFDDPVAAFANLRRAATEDAALRFIAWRSAAENRFMTTAERAAAPLLPNLPARRPDAPGQFFLADRHRICSILEAGGWTGSDIRPIDVDCMLPERELVGYIGRLGPVGLVLAEADEGTRMRVIETVRTAFDPYVQGTEVRFTAACWMVGAHAPSAARSSCA
jgi:SAM-dependent methyltransferase